MKYEIIINDLTFLVPSQCFLAKNVNAKGLMTISTKVVIQMNAKMGGEPWSVDIPIKVFFFFVLKQLHKYFKFLRSCVNNFCQSLRPHPQKKVI